MFELRPYTRRNHMANYNPFREMDEFEKNFFADPFSMFDAGAIAEFKTDITDNGDSYLLEADLPGFDKKDIKLDINGDWLTINAERHSEHEERIRKISTSAASVPTAPTAAASMYRASRPTR